MRAKKPKIIFIKVVKYVLLQSKWFFSITLMLTVMVRLKHDNLI